MQKVSPGKFHFEPPVTSFDHLVGLREQRRRHVEAEGPGGFEIDHELVFRRLLEWQFTGFFTPQNAIDIAGGAAKYLGAIGTVECQAALLDIS
jgi:hypothetical protein